MMLGKIKMNIYCLYLCLRIRIPSGAALFLGFLLSIWSTPALCEAQTLKAGWYSWDPYQYLQESEGVKNLTGLDVKLLKAYAEQAGYKIVYFEKSWKQEQLDIKDGALDIVAGATWNAERAKYAYFSKPYRTETDALYILKDASAPKFKNIPDLLARFKRLKFRLGVVQGYVYADPQLNVYINDPANAGLIVKAAHDKGSLRNLLNHKVDGFLADRTVASTIAWREKRNMDIKEVLLGVSTPLHLMLSKKTATPAMLEKFDKAIVKLRQSGEFFKIIQDYLFPVLLMQTIDQPWFLLIDIMGTVAFAISGLIVAYRVRAGFLGALVFAALPAVGGGIMRDIIVDRRPIGILTTPVYIFAVTATVLAGYLLLKIFSHKTIRPALKKHQKNGAWFSHFLQFFDAIGLACFTITGVVVSLTARCEPLWLWGPILAFITSTGGGILRDVLSSSKSIPSIMGDIYGEIALFWGFILALFMIWQQDNIQPDQTLYAVISVMAGALFTRLIVYFFKLRSPLFVA